MRLSTVAVAPTAYTDGFRFAASQCGMRKGRSTAWYLLLTDIDDLKKAERGSRSSERNLSLTIDTIPTFIHVLRTDGSVLYVNQAVLDYTGLTLEESQRAEYRSSFFPPGGSAKG